MKLNLSQFENKTLRGNEGDVWQVHAFRRDELYQFDIVLQAAAETTFVLKITDQHQPACKSWLSH